MSTHYGIGVQNRYALFMGDEENDPLDFVAKGKVEAVAAQNVHTAATAKKSGAKKTAGSTALATTADSRVASKDAMNGGLTNASKTKQSQAASNKATTNAGNKQNRENSALSAQHSNTFSGTSNSGKRGNDQRRVRDHDATKYANHKGENKQNRPPRQDKSSKPSSQHSNTNTFGTSPNQDSWSQGGTGFGTRDQKDIDERKNRRNLGSYSNEFRDKNDDSGRGRGGRGGRGGFRGRGRGRGSNFDIRGKREYDRQSGSDKTGVKSMEKREGSGARNWGTVADDFEAQFPVNDDGNEWNEKSGDENVFDSTVKEDGVAVEEESVKETEEANAEEEEPKEMTLSEWKKLEEEKRAKPSFNLRKPGEGEDNAQWKKTYVLKKKVEDEEDEYEEVEVEEEIRHGRQKRILDIEINFKDENRDTRRGRGGRGGLRGRGGRGGRGERGDRDRDGDRGDRDRDRDRPEKGRRGGGTFRGRDSHEQSTPQVADWNEFPSLAAA